MENELKGKHASRRQFLKNAAIAGSALCFFPGNFFSSTNSANIMVNSDDNFVFKYRTLSVEHLKEVQNWLEKLKKEDKISKNENYRMMISGFRFDYENWIPNGKSIIIGSLSQHLVSATFRKNGKVYEVVTPTGYYSEPPLAPAIRAKVMKEIIKDPTKKIEGVGGVVPVKTLAVRSGLAEYGKNNITFIDGNFGSFHRLVCYITDQVLPDNWGPLKMMQLCKGCTICIKSCPTKCIRDENFVVEIGNCVTFYNENPAAMPNWIDPKAHNALIGCLKCQDICPANVEAKKRMVKLADFTEKETDLLVNLKKDKVLEDSIIKKLNGFMAAKAEDFPHLSRNLKLVLNNTLPKK